MVSPLLALMRDQLDRLPPAVPGAMLWGGQTRQEAEAVLADVSRGAIKVCAQDEGVSCVVWPKGVGRRDGAATYVGRGGGRR